MSLSGGMVAMVATAMREDIGVMLSMACDIEGAKMNPTPAVSCFREPLPHGLGTEMCSAAKEAKCVL